VTGSLVLLGQSTQADHARTVLVWSSWGVYSAWLFLYQLLGYRTQNRVYRRLVHLENRLGLAAHTFLSNQRSRVRRWVWLLLLIVMLMSGNGVLGVHILIIALIGLAGFVFLMIGALLS